VSDSLFRKAIDVKDSGPIYHETNTNNFIAEPWNAASAILFVFIAMYWVRRLRKDTKERTWLMVYITTLLLAGGIGGALYHGLRSSEWYLLLDFVPIVILCFSTTVFFMTNLFERRRSVVALVTILILINVLLQEIFQKAWTDNLNYTYLGLIVIIPAILYAVKTQFYRVHFFVYSLLAFITALFFRVNDENLSFIFPMGTHFLWHIFGGVCCGFLIAYINSTYTYTRNKKK
jgi:hemolysin III